MWRRLIVDLIRLRKSVAIDGIVRATSDIPRVCVFSHGLLRFRKNAGGGFEFHPLVFNKPRRGIRLLETELDVSSTTPCRNSRWSRGIRFHLKRDHGRGDIIGEKMLMPFAVKKPGEEAEEAPRQSAAEIYLAIEASVTCMDVASPSTPSAPVKGAPDEVL